MRSTAFEPRNAIVGRPSILSTLLIAAALSTWPALGLRPTVQDLGLLSLLGLAGMLMFRPVGCRPVYPYLVAIVLAVTLGHPGLLLGLAVDFGPAGLLILASWCSGVGASDGLQMFTAAPWGHVGMLVGCNIGMLWAGCGRLSRGDAAIAGPAFLLGCNLSMVAGMLVFAGLTDFPTGVGLVGIAGLTLAEMSGGMMAGMLGIWWLVHRFGQPRINRVPVPLSKEKE